MTTGRISLSSTNDDTITRGAVGRLTLASGVGIVVADTVGVGALTTTGFLPRELSPLMILVIWLMGGLLTLSGVSTYSALARAIPRSGGEYRYVYDLLHPLLGACVGWISFIVGFSAPLAMAAYATGAFAETLIPAIPARVFGTLTLVVVALIHSSDLRVSKLTQDWLAIAKVSLLVVFAGFGVVFGATHAGAVFSLSAGPVSAPRLELVGFALITVSVSYSGWNASTYAAEEFRSPKRDVARSMLIGAIVTTLLYLVLNFVFVTALSSDDIHSWTQTDTERITLAHVLATRWMGAGGGVVLSAAIVLVLVSSISAMSMTGPRVYSAMAKDGILPKLLLSGDHRPPAIGILTQTVIALVMLHVGSYETLLSQAGFLLTLSSALAGCAYFAAVRKGLILPTPIRFLSAAVFVVASFAAVVLACLANPAGLAWTALAIICIATVSRASLQSASLQRDKSALL